MQFTVPIRDATYPKDAGEIVADGKNISINLKNGKTYFRNIESIMSALMRADKTAKRYSLAEAGLAQVIIWAPHHEGPQEWILHIYVVTANKHYECTRKSMSDEIAPTIIKTHDVPDDFIDGLDFSKNVEMVYGHYKRLPLSLRPFETPSLMTDEAIEAFLEEHHPELR